MWTARHFQVAVSAKGDAGNAKCWLCVYSDLCTGQAYNTWNSEIEKQPNSFPTPGFLQDKQTKTEHTHTHTYYSFDCIYL